MTAVLSAAELSAAALSVPEPRSAGSPRAVEAWWRELPNAFSVVRGARGEVVAYSILAFAGQVNARLASEDPVAASWLAHVASSNLPEERPVLFSRRLVTRDGGVPLADLAMEIWAAR